MGIQIPNDEFWKVVNQAGTLFYDVEDWDDQSTSNVLAGLLTAVFLTVYKSSPNDESASKMITKILTSTFLKQLLEKRRNWIDDKGKEV